MDIAERNRLVIDNLPLVGYLVSDLCARATHLSREDMASVGAIGLVLAADSFDPAAGVPFGAYARRRINGALVDELRSMDWAGRGTRQKIKALQGMSETLAARLGRAPSEDEMAAALGVTREQVRASMADAARSVGPLDDTADFLVAEGLTPDESLLERERSQYLGAAVAALPERLRHIVTEVYLEGKSVKEVAEALGLTSSAVSQQRSEALRLLRGGLELHFADADERLEESALAGGSTARRVAYLDTLKDAVSGFNTRPTTPRGSPVTHPQAAASA